MGLFPERRYQNLALKVRECGGVETAAAVLKKFEREVLARYRAEQRKNLPATAPAEKYHLQVRENRGLPAPPATPTHVRYVAASDDWWLQTGEQWWWLDQRTRTWRAAPLGPP